MNERENERVRDRACVRKSERVRESEVELER